MIAAAICMLISAHARAEGLREVRNEVAGLLAHPALVDAEIGALVVPVGGHGELFSLHPERALIPASNMKLITVATALELLGADAHCPRMPGAREEETVGELARRILKPSDNALADALVAALPEAAGRPGLTPQQLCGETLGERGVYLRGTRWADGSGLSRDTLMSTGMIVDLLEAIDRSRWREQFIGSLPIAGVDGTLRERMREGPARGRISAKTGTLTGVSALSGYARTVSGERLVFAMVMNGFACDVDRVRRIQDRVCEVLVRLDREGMSAERAAGD
jgi:D-alanyl-D-alanine carboxypeptidase/D-alanyl-D-alanine-endopeptidase (penicillin-binding protein 4)